MKDIHGFGSLFSQGGEQVSKEILGGKGAGLCEMAKIGVNIPPGIIIPTTTCLDYLNKADTQEELMDDLMVGIIEKMDEIEGKLGHMPLFSVRSGARVSMPGMMDTILNVGMTEETLGFWKVKIGERAAYDCYRRLLQMIGEVSFEIPKAHFDKKFSYVRSCKWGLKEPPETDAEMTAKHFQQVVIEYMKLFGAGHKERLSTLHGQIRAAVQAVFKSWNNERAISYRNLNGIPHGWGTAVIIQMMVFGNMNDNSGSGVLFTRDPATGEKKVIGEFLPNAQGEDVVAGIRTPLQIEEMKLHPKLKVVYKPLVEQVLMLEQHYKDMQDVEFTVQDGQLFILQTRSGKRSSQAAFRIAVELTNEGLISKKEAFTRIRPKDLERLGKVVIPSSFTTEPDAVGIPAGGSVVSGTPVFSAKAAMEVRAADPKAVIILVTHETTPDDIEGMNAADAILTATGGATSHAAVVARGMNKTCVVGVTSMKVSSIGATVGEEASVGEGSLLTIDGTTGRVWVNTEVPVEKVESDEFIDQMVAWALESGTVVEMVDLKTYKLQKGRTYAVDTSGVKGIEFQTCIQNLIFEAVKLGCTLILSMYTENDYREPEDEILWKAFGEKAKVGDETIAEFLTEAAGKWKKEDLARIHLFLPDRLRAVGSVISAAKAAGFKIGGEINSMSELMDAEGFVKLSQKLVTTVGGDKKTQKLLEALKKGGMTFEPIPKIASKQKVLFDCINAND